MKHQITGRTLRFTFNNDQWNEHAAKWPIKEVIFFKNAIVLRVEPPPGSNENENVYAIGMDGHIIWRVHKRHYVYPDSPYTKIGKEGNKLLLFNWDGFNLVVDTSIWKEIGSCYQK